MEIKSNIHNNIISKILKRERNPRVNSFLKKFLLHEKSKTISSLRKPPPPSFFMDQVPVLSFPMSDNTNNNGNNNSSKISSLHFTPRERNNPVSLKTKTSSFYRNKPKMKIDFNNNYLKKVSKSILNRPVILGRTIEKKIRDSKRSQRLKRVDMLDFGKNLKLYDSIEKKHKFRIIVEKRKKQLEELYYDYDKKNRHIIKNSFSGNRTDLLKNKIFFVKGIVDYIYPKAVLNRVDCENELKISKYKDERKQLEESQKGKFFSLKHKNPEQNAAMSKYLYGEYLDDSLIKSKKTLVNKCIVSKLLNDYDFV
jgi:hypothetical protein